MTGPRPSSKSHAWISLRWGVVGIGLFLSWLGPGLVASSSSRPAAGPPRDAVLRPVAVWPPGPLEVIAAFDKPIDAALAKTFIGRAIPYVEGQAATLGVDLPSKSSGTLRIVAARRVDGGRTLVLA